MSRDARGLEAWEGLFYENIAHACLLIALDNGGVNRGRSVRKWRGDFERFIERQAAPLVEIDAWLGTLSKEQMETVTAGGADEPETKALLAAAPAFTADLLNTYFDEVC